MNLFSRTVSGLFALTILLLICTNLSAEWLFELGTVTDALGNRVSLRDLQRKDEQMSRELQSTIEHLYSKDSIADALSRGELTLLDAAVRFRSLYANPKAWHNPQRSRPALEDGEAWCREVIDWTELKIRIEQSPDRADALRQSLEAALQEQLASRGRIDLPD